LICGRNAQAGRIEGVTIMKKKQVCMLCGKPAPKSICDSCSENVRGEALHKKKKDQKPS
jgi:hypothetical protein